ncbi:arylsulfatase [Bremerella sp. T1]|uniref:arylsulfatase n=1 Tax=Bremerella sp. TYQ1 TaxID=3119568 RepID=UPI001CCA29DC|nr:arylsulfatase [Bremerella volcania]UBM36593.1 arylsulfatase [Bremerella volcania]
MLPSRALLIASVGLVIAGQLCFAAVLCAASAERPNVVLIMTDDQGYGEFSCHGNPIAKTPHIDKLASEAVRLTDFHVSPMCTPTRGQLMTGLDAFRNGAINVSSGRTLLRPELKTIADVFRTGGYRTGLFGKWHLGDNYPFRPEDRGFDEALWFPSSHINSVPDYWNNDYFDDTYIHNTQRVRRDGYCTDVFFDEAIKWMDQQDEQPFFAYIALNAAHWPWFVPDHYRSAIREALDDNNEISGNIKPVLRDNLISFLAMGTNIDDNVGKLDRFLRESEQMNNTIVVFLTDNGSTMGPKYFNAGMRGGKTTLWEGGHRVPCFIRWPNGLKLSHEVDDLCHVQDLLPTLAALSGIAEHTPEKLDGTSLKAVLEDPDMSLEERMLVINYSRMPTFRVKYTTENPALPHKDGALVMWKHWRLLENRELYNVKDDPEQRHNIAARHQKIVEKMRARLDGWWSEVEGDVLTPQRVIIGHNAENPLLLTACEWLDVFVDQQIQIRRGVPKNGSWHVTVAETGTYELELRRWPKESRLKLHEGCPELQVTDGTFLEGTALPIARATLRLDDRKILLAQPDRDKTAFVTQAKLDSGPLEIRATFFDKAGTEICGAYYLYVRRID